MFRAALRTLIVGFLAICALLEILIVIPFVSPRRRLEVRARWLGWWSRLACWFVSVHVEVRGTVPKRGLLISNHLSYLDIIVISSVHPCLFVARHDLAAWPLFGPLTSASGTIYVDRASRVDAARTLDRMREAIAADMLVVLFPEGTSSNGAGVLPFKSALLEAVAELQGDVNAAAIDYRLVHGSVANDICYWGDATFVPHLWNLFRQPEIEAKLVFMPFNPGDRTRKELAVDLHREVSALKQSLRSTG